MKTKLGKWLWLGLALMSTALLRANGIVPEPGAESGGMRLRLRVTPASNAANDVYEVRLDLINVMTHPIKLIAGWRYDTDKGDFKDYLEAAVSIETVPPIAPWLGQTWIGERKTPQPTYEMQPNSTLSLKWSSPKRQLKSKVSDPIEIQNPYFPNDGLYEIHAAVTLQTANGPVFLRSNAQQISVAGSEKMPKYTFGRIRVYSETNRSVILDLGSAQGVSKGDQFLILTGLININWRFTVTNVGPTYSLGSIAEDSPKAESHFPKSGAMAILTSAWGAHP
jgi:hypothetical protein